MKGSWNGKIIGGVCGSMLGGKAGAFIGIIIGHLFDTNFSLSAYLNPKKSASSQSVFFNTTFLIMGYIAKADGRVSENEILVAEKIMKRFTLTQNYRKHAIRLFNRGKQPHFNISHTLQTFKKTCQSDYNLMHLFLDIQIESAYADGSPPFKIKRLLRYIASFLDLEQINFYYYDMLSSPRTKQDFQDFSYQNSHQEENKQQKSHTIHPSSTLKEAYLLLNIRHNTSDTEVKKAYRRMMNQHHPDKLIAKGLPKEMIKLATEKTQKISTAYEEIRKHRKI